jgi:hypothetical protein
MPQSFSCLHYHLIFRLNHEIRTTIAPFRG